MCACVRTCMRACGVEIIWGGPEIIWGGAETVISYTTYV